MDYEPNMPEMICMSQAHHLYGIFRVPKIENHKIIEVPGQF